MKTNDASLDAVGSSLLEHSKSADFTARGIIEELFPYIVQASKRMSARAISDFLETTHGVKLSFVSIGKALRNPVKSWNRYYDLIEPHAWKVADVHSVSDLRSFISDPEKYDDLLKTKKVYPYTCGETKEENEASMFQSLAEYEEAVKILDEKWYCFDEDVLEDARFHLLPRLIKRPPDENRARGMEQEDL